MVKFSVLVPDATVNYIENPNCRYDTTGYNAFGSTLTRSLDFARFGIASCRVVTNGAALREGVYYRVNTLQGISDSITVSAYVIGTGMVRIRLIDNPNGKEWSSQNVTLSPTRFTRLSVTGTITGSNDVRLYVETNEGSAKARTFYVGGLQMERKAYPTTFCDGDQPGCRWNGIYHSSSSQRPVTTRTGGKWTQLAGTDREQEDLYMTVVGGLGMAPLKNNVQDFALASGGFFSNSKIEQRLMTFAFHAKHHEDSRFDPLSLDNLHKLRQLLIDITKPDVTAGSEPMWFEYQDGATPIYFQARYDGGLEGDWDIRNEFFNSFPLRLLAENPIFLEDQQTVKQLDFQESTKKANNILGRINNAWNNVNYGIGDFPSGLAEDARGRIYIVGNFVKANNDATAIDPLINANGVAFWDGTKWNRMGSGMNIPYSTQGHAVAVGPNGDVYVVGNFTSIGGVAANRVARWDGSAWNAMGTGLNGTGEVVAVAPNGDVYVGGTFTTAGGVACVRIARWDGTKWNRVGQFGGLNNPVYAIAFNQDGSVVYVGGNFTDQNGFAANALLHVAQYNTETGLFSAMGSGFNNDVLALHVTEVQLVYAGGPFTLSGSATMKQIALWNGSVWIQLGNGLDPGVRDIDSFPDGTLVIVGSFTSTGDVPLRDIALWNGSTFVNLDIQIGSASNTVVLVSRQGDIYIGGSFSVAANSTIFYAGSTTFTNLGSIECRSSIYARGPGRLVWVENQTNRKRLYLNLDLLNGEEVFFDFNQGTVKSTMRGDLFNLVLPGSDFRAFSLLPGDNLINCLMLNDVGAIMQMSLTPQHWSMDATG